VPFHTKHQERESKVTLNTKEEKKKNHLTNNVAKAASKPGSGSIRQSAGTSLLFSSFYEMPPTGQGSWGGREILREGNLGQSSAHSM
jgi:hypothetical protein